MGDPYDPVPIRSLLILTNPGSRQARKVRQQLESLLADHHDRLEIHWKDVFSPSQFDQQVDRVLLVGGDGTINLGLSWLKSAGIVAPVALIPAGTGNNLARGMGIPVAVERSIELALGTSTTHRIDGVDLKYDGESAGMMLQVAAAGMPAHVAGRFDRLRHLPVICHPIRWSGDWIYRLLALLTIAGQQNREFDWQLELDGELLEVQGAALFFGNEGTIGGGFTPCPEARIDDGLLDVCLLPTLPFGETLRLFKQVSAGTHLEENDAVIYRQCRTVRFRQVEGPFLVDGDIRGNPQRIELECSPGAVELVLPEGADIRPSQQATGETELN
ncbi:MAG: diacylglycerol kinase family protein [Planctomycetota bacterium]|nr:diacylglycerol kinase family protein [Planctomycetota bacterium]